MLPCLGLLINLAEKLFGVQHFVAKYLHNTLRNARALSPFEFAISKSAI
jgi:hypothetical protein